MGKNKLRSYSTFNTNFEAEAYVRANLPRAQRRALAQLRTRVALLALETGRYQGLTVKERLCFHCKSLDMENVDDEKHIILTCPLCDAHRATLFTRQEESIQGFLIYQRRRNSK